MEEMVVCPSLGLPPSSGAPGDGGGILPPSSGAPGDGGGSLRLLSLMFNILMLKEPRVSLLSGPVSPLVGISH